MKKKLLYFPIDNDTDIDHSNETARKTEIKTQVENPPHT